MFEETNGGLLFGLKLLNFIYKLLTWKYINIDMLDRDEDSKVGKR